MLDFVMTPGGFLACLFLIIVGLLAKIADNTRNKN